MWRKGRKKSLISNFISSDFIEEEESDDEYESRYRRIKPRRR